MIRGLAFDAFGTLLKPVPANGAYGQLAVLSGMDAGKFRQLALTEDVGLRALADRFGLSGHADGLESELNLHLGACELFSDVPLALEMASALPFVVCSNLATGYCGTVRRLVPAAAGYVFSCEVGHAKPDPAIYREVSERLALPPEEILFVGDTPRMDVEGPIAFGMAARLVSRRSGVSLVDAVLDGLASGRVP